MSGGLDEIRIADRSATEEFWRRREAVLGRRLNVAYEPEQAARELAELLGSRTLAYRWITAVAKAAS